MMLPDVTRHLTRMLLQGLAVLLLLLIMAVPESHAQSQLVSISIEEKDLFHQYIPSPAPAAPCTSFTSANLPPGSTFDSSSGLFTWLPDYGSAGSYTASFACADDPNNPGTQQLQISVTPVTPVYVQSTTPKVTLLAAANPATIEQANDQKSLAVMLGVYGLSVQTVSDLGAAFTAKTVGDILVVPSYMAASLTPDTIQKVVSFVNGGGKILLFGRSPLSQALGISYAGGTRTVNEFIDYLNPKLFLKWTDGETVDDFTVTASDSVLTADKQGQPIAIGRSAGNGRILYVGSSYYDRYSVYGTKGHPYLLYHFMDVFRLKPMVSASSIDAYFDPGNYDLSKVYIEDIVRMWAERGITTVYTAAWHFWINEQTGAEWTFGYDHFIDVCHQRGIKVYAWYALPHVSQKFWFTRPECREKTAGTGDNYIFWRLNVNLQNQACLASVYEFMDDTLNRYDWDGINIAEIYYDYEKGAIEYFTPMNEDFRANYKALSGTDPLNFFDSGSPFYYLNNEVEWKKFLSYRTDIVTGLHDAFMNRIFAHPKSAEREVVLTIVDSLNYDYADIVFPDVPSLIDTGVDLPAIVKLREKYDFTMQIEDPWPFWSSNPFRYNDFKKTYVSNFLFLNGAPDLIFFDVNFVEYAHTRANSDPMYGYPSRIQTGMEFALLMKNMFMDSNRLAAFSENTMQSVDLERVKWAFGADVKVSINSADTIGVETARTVKLEGLKTFYSVSLDGKHWPAWNVADGTVLLPAGNHLLRLDAEGAYTGIRLVGTSCSLEDAAIVPGGITVNYNSPRQKAVLTIEAFAKQDNEPFQVLVDGQVYNARVYPFYGHYHLFLPKGKHTVQIRVVHELTAGSGQSGGASDVSINRPVVITFSNPIDPATLTTASIILKDGSNTPVAGTVSYDPATMSAVFRPDQALELSTTYTLTATTGVTDIFGKKLPAAANMTVTTDSYGDINGTKKVDISAALKYLRVALGLDPQPAVSTAQIIIAPVNRATGKPQPQPGRTRVNLQDALAALERSVGLW